MRPKHISFITKEGEYYSNVSLGDLLECFYAKKDRDKFMIRDVKHFTHPGFYLGVAIERIL